MFMSGSVFENLPALQKVYLQGNECINQDFETVEQIRGISKTVNATCGFGKNGTRIACEIIEETVLFKYGYFTCEMKTYTTIKDITYSISDLFNNKVVEMDFDDNRNIEFLPISLHQTFPNIEWYHAERCAIKEISKKNFERLIQLESIHLEENQIYAILKDTFDGLINLETLNLSKFRLLCLTVGLKFFNLLHILQTKTKSGS